MGVCKRASADEQRARAPFDELCESRHDLRGVGRLGNDQVQPEHSCSFLHIGAFGHNLRHGARTEQHCDRARLGGELTQQVQPLGSELAREEDYAREIAPGPAEAGDQAVPHRITAGRENDRDGRSRSLRGQSRNRVGDDDSCIQADQIRQKRRQPFIPAFGPALTVTLRPSTNPSSLSPRRKAATMYSNDADGVLRSRPTTGIADCWARAANGHAAVVPPSRVMKSRRFIRSPHRHATETVQESSVRVPLR
jgi:hypothetical protein